MEIAFIQVFFFSVGFKQKNKNENTEYNGSFIPFKSQLYSKPGSSIFLLFESWILEYWHLQTIQKSALLKTREIHFFLV